MTEKERIGLLRDKIEIPDAVVNSGASDISAASECKFIYQDNDVFCYVIGDDVQNSFRCWAGFLRGRADVSLPDNPLYAAAHAERVLLYAPVSGGRMYPGRYKAPGILARAVRFHDTRRRNEFYDSGHEARTAVHYKDFCQRINLGRNAEASVFMHFHDIDDKRECPGQPALGRKRP